MNRDLLDSLGGEPAIAAVVDALYVRLVDDPRVQHHFHPTRLESLKAGQRAWFVAALTGDDLPTDLGDMHARLDISDEQVGVVVGHLGDILGEVGVSAYIRRSVLSLVSRLWYARNF